MPLYEYRCNDCGLKDQQQIHKYGDDHGPCEKCGGLNLTKQLGVPVRPRMDGLSSMSVRHTTQETFGPNNHGGTTKIGHMEYFPEEVDTKKKEYQKKQESKGATVSVKNIPNKK